MEWVQGSLVVGVGGWGSGGGADSTLTSLIIFLFIFPVCAHPLVKKCENS